MPRRCNSGSVSDTTGVGRLRGDVDTDTGCCKSWPSLRYTKFPGFSSLTTCFPFTPKSGARLLKVLYTRDGDEYPVRWLVLKPTSTVPGLIPSNRAALSIRPFWDDGAALNNLPLLTCEGSSGGVSDTRSTLFVLLLGVEEEGLDDVFLPASASGE